MPGTKGVAVESKFGFRFGGHVTSWLDCWRPQDREFGWLGLVGVAAGAYPLGGLLGVFMYPTAVIWARLVE